MFLSSGNRLLNMDTRVGDLTDSKAEMDGTGNCSFQASYKVNRPI